MSEYGRLYEEVSRIREELKRYRYTKRPDEPLVDTMRLGAAKASVQIVKLSLDSLIAQWEKLEAEMEKADDR